MLWCLTQRCVVLRDVIVRFAMLRDWHVSWHTKYSKQGIRPDNETPHAISKRQMPRFARILKLQEQQRTLSKVGGRQGVKATINCGMGEGGKRDSKVGGERQWIGERCK